MKAVDIGSMPELVRLAEEVRQSGEPLVLQENARPVAILRPIRYRRNMSHKPCPVTRDDPLFQLVGIGQSAIPGGISEKKHEYLLRAHRSTHA